MADGKEESKKTVKGFPMYTKRLASPFILFSSILNFHESCDRHVTCVAQTYHAVGWPSTVQSLVVTGTRSTLALTEKTTLATGRELWVK